MRVDFMKPMLDTGFTECPYCGKMVSESNAIQGLCPDCAMQKD